MKEFFSIGETSKLNNIPIKTLRYYDEIGLLKPHYINENSKYRYYSYDQFVQIEIIRFSKTLGYSLDDISSMIDSEDIYNIKEKLLNQREKASQRMMEIENAVDNIDKLLNRIDKAIDLKSKNGVYMAIYPKIQVLLEPAQPNDTIETMDFRLKSKLIANPKIIPTTMYGYTLDFSELIKGKTVVSGAFVECEPSSINQELLTTIPGGKYCCTKSKILMNESISNDFIKMVKQKDRPTDVIAQEIFYSLTAWQECEYEIMTLSEEYNGSMD